MSVALLAQREPAFQIVSRIDLDDLDDTARIFAGQQSTLATLLNGLRDPLAAGGSAMIGQDPSATGLFGPTYRLAADAIAGALTALHPFIGDIAQGLAASATDHERADLVSAHGYRGADQTAEHHVTTDPPPDPIPELTIDGYADPQIDENLRDVWPSFDADRLHTVAGAWGRAASALDDIKVTLTNAINAVVTNNAGEDITALTDYWAGFTRGDRSLFTTLHTAITTLIAGLDYYANLLSRWHDRYTAAAKQITDKYLAQGQSAGANDYADAGWGIGYLIEYLSGDIADEIHQAIQPINNQMNDELLASQQYRDLTDICITRVHQAQLTIPTNTTTTTTRATDGPIDQDHWDDAPTRTIAATIASHGHVVTAVDNDPRHKTPDALVDGQPVEFKSITGDGPRTVRNALVSSEKKGAQARDMVFKIDEKSNLDGDEVRKQIDDFFREYSKGEIRRITVFCKDGSKVTYPPGYGGL